MKTRHNVFFLLLLLQLLTLCAMNAWSRPLGLLDEWPTSPLRPYDIVFLSDNSVWLTHYNESATSELEAKPIVFSFNPTNGDIKRCDESITERAHFNTLDRGPDDTIWIADSINQRLVHFIPSECDDPETDDPAIPNLQADAFTSHPLDVAMFPVDDTGNSCSRPMGISVNDDGLVWFTCWNRSEPSVGRFDPAAETAEDAWQHFPLPREGDHPPGTAVEIAFGSDGNVWFTISGHAAYGGNAGLGRLDPRIDDGDIRLWTDPDLFPVECFELTGRPFTFHGITARENTVWFIDHSNSSLLSFDLSAETFTCFPMPRGEEETMWDIHYFTQDQDGLFWMTAFVQSAITTFAPDTEAFDTLPLTPGAAPMGIAMAPGGEIWWAESFSDDQGGVGRFRPPSTLIAIVEPTESDPAWAGTSTDGNRVFVRLIGAEDMDMSLANLSIAVDGEVLEPNQIVLDSFIEIESETWLVIKPGAKTVDTCYDLTISLIDTPDATATASQSLCYEDAEGRVIDRVVAIDRTNSMNYDSVRRVRSEEKMNAARAAGQFFVSLSNDQDGIGVVSFQRTDENSNGSIEEDEFSESVILLEPIVDDDQRRHLRELIWDIEPGPGGGSETSLGAGLLEAKTMFDSSPHADSEKIIVLVTDGRENFPPFWSRDSKEWYEGSGPTVKPIFEALDPPGISIDTVSIGLDAENAVLRDMSDLTGGKIRNELEGTGSFGLLSRLASTFKAIDEDNRGEQRFHYREGWPDHTVGGEFLEIKEGVFTVEEHLDWMTAAFHWNTNGAGADLRLIDPDGNPVETTRKNQRHAVYHVPLPRSGVWRYQVSVNNPAVEFFAVASAPTLLTARLRIGNTTADDGGTWTTPLRVWIADESAVLDAEVSATIRRPNKGKFSVLLRDDGISSDGAAGDGVYGVLITDTPSGPYFIDLVARGTAITGEPFERFMTGTFIIPGEPVSPGQVGEDIPVYDDWVSKLCGGAIWCCWLWIVFIVTLIAALLMFMWLLCYFRTVANQDGNVTTRGPWLPTGRVLLLLIILAIAIFLGRWLLFYCGIALCWFLLGIALAIIIAGLVACFTPVVRCIGMKEMN